MSVCGTVAKALCLALRLDRLEVFPGEQIGTNQLPEGHLYIAAHFYSRKRENASPDFPEETSSLLEPQYHMRPALSIPKLHHKTLAVQEY